MTSNQIAQIANTRILPIPWDSDIYNALFTESPTEQLRSMDDNVEALLTLLLDTPSFTAWATDLAEEHDCDLEDILRSISRTLNYALLIR